MLGTPTTEESDALDHERLFHKACEIAQLAGQLLIISGGLLDRALATCTAATASGIRVTKTIALLKQQLDKDASVHLLGTRSRSDIKDATIAAHNAAREAASAALDIRKVIGGPSTYANRYTWPSPSATVTLVEIEEMLQQLSAQATNAVQSRTVHKKEMATIASGIFSMLEVASRNKAVAVEAATAVERIHINAINFVREVERSGLS